MEEQEKLNKKDYIPAQQEVIETEPEWMFTICSDDVCGTADVPEGP